MKRASAFILGIAAAVATAFGSGPAVAKGGGEQPAGRTVVADVVAINQPLIYNRFNSVNPWGMIYALRTDVDGCDRAALDPQKCSPGHALLKPTKRPRPLILRVSKGDTLVIRFQNLLRRDGEGARPLTNSAAGFDETATDKLPDGVFDSHEHGHCPPSDVAHAMRPDCDPGSFQHVPNPPDDPKTRRATLSIVGLTNFDQIDPRASGLIGIEPGEETVYRFRADEEGAYFFSSLAAMAGGEGDGGSLTHGLFGMVLVEPVGAKYYRSQVSEKDLACAKGEGSDCGHNALASQFVNYEATGTGNKPLLNMLMATSYEGQSAFEIVHSDLTAIVWDKDTAGRVGQPASDENRVDSDAWREFAILFHDELKTVHADDFPVLNDPGPDASEVEKARHKQMAGARDGFAINYGASGMGPIVLANRGGRGPAKDCVDCAYEEFFLQSWANGDPALLAQYEDDPSNVYHSYLGDRVKFFNAHAGPKETHVFHLHAHQWLSQARNDQANYLDSQTIAPFQTFSYEIYYGGTGNRNFTPGDSIFHCHLYPHFAQGMWGLWRVHEVIEDGSRRLPDGGGMDGEFAGKGTDPMTGLAADGTPIPGLVPLPGQVLPPMPTYPMAADERYRAPIAEAMPGYPFYIPGKAGFRAPQPPLDMAIGPDGTYLDGGLPRHITLAGERVVKFERPDGTTAVFPVSDLNRSLDEGTMAFDVTSAKIEILPQAGTKLEQAAMRFHERNRKPGFFARLFGAEGENMLLRPYSTDLASKGRFLVNGQPREAGSPFANPCPERGRKARHWAPGLQSQMTGTREYDVAAIEMQLLVNQYGWHDPQARINVLQSKVNDYLPLEAATPQEASPFFFRAASGECIVFRHQNRTRGKTDFDPFQVETPVDIIGQHIHLVKFDVTSSDGSANGFNYEDGTYAYDHIAHLIEASNAPGGGIVAHDDLDPSEMPAKLVVREGEGKYQTTTQRWWADPLLDKQGRDRTISTVFTHDHFGPSTIQQHGFYSALLIEPRGSTWLKPDGTALDGGVGTQAIIRKPKSCKNLSKNLCENRREFAMAVADFALLYDDKGSDPRKHDQFDRPIAPPLACVAGGSPCAAGTAISAGTILSRPAVTYRGEAISVDHHDPYLFNYKNEPIPLRIGDSSGGAWEQFRNPDGTISARGDMVNVFNSSVHDQFANSDRLALIDRRANHRRGDPSTEIFEGYVGDKAQVRLIQGAQEVQHVFTISGRNWLRQPAADEFHDNARVSAQEVGISEHFEMDFDLPVGTTFRGQTVFDYLYMSGTVDALWNGAWGLLRSFPSYTSSDTAQSRGGAHVSCRLALVDGPIAQASLANCDKPSLAAAFDRYNPIAGTNPAPAPSAGLRPVGTTLVPRAATNYHYFCIAAFNEPIEYNGRDNLSDPDAARFGITRHWVTTSPFAPQNNRTDHRSLFHASSRGGFCERAAMLGDNADLVGAQWKLVQNADLTSLRADRARPMVMRVNSGDMIVVAYENRMSSRPEATSGNAWLPPIVGSDQDATVSDRMANDRLDPSRYIGLYPALVSVDVTDSVGVGIGASPMPSLEPAGGGTVAAGGAAEVGANPALDPAVWYAGRVVSPNGSDRPTTEPFYNAQPLVAPLSSFADPIRHPAMGLVGALVIEPEGSSYEHVGTTADVIEVTDRNGGKRKEAVLVYQDGLNLKRNGEPVPDCHICDDSYDSGDVAVNYGTEPIWARLGLPMKAGESNPETGLPSLIGLSDFDIPATTLLPDAQTLNGRAIPAGLATPIIKVCPGDRLTLLVTHPGGRARQRAFVTYGKRYDDLGLPKFGSPTSSLLAPQKGVTVDLGTIARGRYLWRDGPGQFFAGGAWGFIEASDDEPQQCPAQP